jgi:Putative lumazine-binding
VTLAIALYGESFANPIIAIAFQFRYSALQRRDFMKHFPAFGFVILALSMSIPVSGMCGREVTAAEEVFSNPESLARSLYAAVTFDPGTSPDWSYVRKFFLPEAVIGVRKTRTTMEVMDVEAFVKWFEDDIKRLKMEEKGFEESVQTLKLTVFGDIAQCFVVYKARLKTPADSPGQLGLDSFALMKKDGRWWVVSIVNDIVTPERPLPEELK